MTTSAAPGGRRHVLLWILLAVIIAASAGASWVQSSFGRVDIRGLVLPTQNGQWVAADLFRPRSATAENPAPLVVVVPGFQRSKETLSNIAIELARRGVVVISIDPYAQGSSSSSESRRAATTEGYGMFAVVDYVHDAGILNYVDKARIATTGHSAGGNAAIRGAARFGKLAKKSGEPSKLHSVFVSGYVLTLTDNVLRHVRSNAGVSYALWDEGAYRNELGHGDMREAPEALRFVNAGRDPAEPPIERVQIGERYGEVANRNLRIVHNERLLHPFQPYSVTATANQLEFFEHVFELESGIASHDQIWFWKEILTSLALLAALVSLVPIARLLLTTPYFAGLVHDVPDPQPRPSGSSRWVFWGVFTFSALLACVTFVPLCELSQELFVDASSRRQTWFFPQRMNNAVMLWAFLNGSVGLLVFGIVYRLHGRKHGARPETWGARIGLRELARTGLLALSVSVAFFGVLFAVDWFFHVDYRFVFLGVRAFQPELVPLVAMYVPAFFVFFLANSLRVNGSMRFLGSRPIPNALLGAVANSLGLALILVIQYGTLAATGTVFWTDSWLYVNLLFGVLPVMFALPLFHRAFFQMTGRIWLGAIVMCLVFVTILLTNTVCYLPL